MDSRHFYRDLPPFHRFTDGVLSPAVYRPLPDDWTLLVADVDGSTRAVDQGRYAEVNYLGAACIVAVSNALDGLVVPASFGGDGATLAVPPCARDAGVDALLATRLWGRAAFGLDLRVGAVPASELARRDEAIHVAKLEFSPGNAMAMFRGAGFDRADRLIKEDAGDLGYRLDDAPSGADAPDLHTLSCRWAPMPSERGVMLCLIVAAQSDGLAASDDAFREALRSIDAIAALDARETSPVKLALLSRRLRPSAMRKEVAHEPGPRWRRWPAVVLRHLIQAAVFRLDLEPGGFDPRRYREDVIVNSDFRRLAGALRLVLDCSTAQADAIESALSELQRTGRIRFGSHRSPEAIMTCVTPNVDNHEHVHYIDGGDGGLYVASRVLKERLAQDAQPQ